MSAYQISTKELAAALSAVKPGVTPSAPYVMLTADDGDMSVVADNLDIRVAAVVPDAIGSGDVVALHAPLAAFVAKVDAGAITAQVGDDRTLELRAGRSKMRVGTVATDTFPQRPRPDSEPSVLTADEWATIRALVPFTATRSADGILTGVSIDPEGAVAQDRLRLAMWDHPFGFSAVVPGQVIAAVGDVADSVSLTYDGGTLEVAGGGVIVTSSVLAGDYPSVRPQIAEIAPVGTITCDPDELAHAVELASLLSKDGTAGSRVVILDVSDDGLVVESWPAEGSNDVITRQVDATVSNVEDRFAIHSSHVAPFLSVLGCDDEITVNYAGYGKPLIARNRDVTAMIGYIAVKS